MRGFQPGKARAVPQNYADGGVVSTIKGMLGFGGGKKKPEPLPADLNKMPPPAAGQAASQPEPPKKAISEYSGMSALERRMKAAGLADGGLVRGPGTGISDDIEDEVEEGTFIMPADSTEAIGPEVMERAGKAVPVRLSNGEAKLPPEALQAIGAQVMEAIKDVTHVPAAKQARGFPMGEQVGPELDDDDDRMNFADGGVVDDKRRPRTVADLARSPGYGAGAGGPVSTPVRPQAPAARPQAAQPVPGVTRQGNSYSAAPVQGPLGSGMYQLDSNLPKPPNIQAQAQRPAPAPAQRPPAPAPAQSVQQPVQNPAQPRPTYTGSTVADRARSPAFGMGAGAYTPKPAAQVAPAAPRPAAAPATSASAAMVAMPGQKPEAPTQTKPLPTGWATDGERFMPGVQNVWNESGKAIGDLVGQGRYGAAAGETARAAASYVPAFFDDTLGGAYRSIAPGVIDATKQFFGVGDVGAPAPSAAQKMATPPAAPTAPVAANPAATPPTTQPKPEPKTDPTKAPAPTGAREVTPGIYRQGNSYGDSPEAAASGARPSQGPSAQNQSIAAALAQRSGQRTDQPTDVMGIYARASDAMKGAAQVQREIDGNQSQRGPGSTFIKHSGNDWESENNLKNLRTSASSIFNKRGPRGAPSVEEMAYMKALDADLAARNGNNPAAIEAMRQQGETARIGMREAGENARSGRREGIAAELGRGQLDLQRNAQGFTTRQLERQEKLYADYDAAKTPEERATIAQKIRDLSGKNTDPKDNFMIVGGGQEWDEKAGAMRNVPQRLIDLRTGQEVGGGAGAKPMAMPKTQDELKVGQVYDTNKGPATWDGKQFTAVAG